MRCRNYRAIIKNSAPVSETLKKEVSVSEMLKKEVPAPTPAPAASEKKSEKKKNEKKVSEKKVSEKKPKKTEDDGWVTVEKKHSIVF